MKKIFYTLILISCSIYLHSQQGNIELQGFTIDSIKFYERGETLPKPANRLYSSSFYKEFVRFIAVDVHIQNHLYGKAKQEHAIELIWYDSQGIVEGKQDDIIEIQSDWSTSTFSTNGWGWNVPDKWTPGVYKVDIYIDKSKVAEERVIIKEKEYNIENIKIFGFKDIRPEKKNRIYSYTFNTDSIKYLSVELNFNNLLFEQEHQEHSAMLKWFTFEGESEGKQTGTVKIDSEWKSSSNTFNGWGNSELGNWDTGKYKVEVYLDNNLVETKIFEIKNTNQIAAETVVGGPDQKVLIMQKPTIDELYGTLTISGIEATQAQTLASLAAGRNTTVYKVGETLFIGTEEQIKAGNYEVAGICSFGSQFPDIAMISLFQDGKIKHTHLEDRIINYKNGSVLDFTITMTENGRDGKPLNYFVTEYQNGKLFGTGLYPANIEEFSLQYDPSGTLRNMEELQSGSGGNYIFMKIVKGFKIINRSNPLEVFYFDRNGRALLPVDETNGSNINGSKETVGFDRLQDMTINIAEYGTGQKKTVHMHNIEKVSVIMSISEFGELSRSNTSSFATGHISEINYIGDKSGSTFRVTSYRELRSVKTETGESITMVMSKNAALGSPWLGKKGNKLYTELANGLVRHTGWQETRNVKSENGVLLHMTVSRALPKEAPWYGEMRDKVYTELENGLFRRTGQTKIVAHEIDGAVFNIKAYARTAINTEEVADVKWSYLFDGKTYEQSKANDFACTREHRYETYQGEVVTMNRDVVPGDNAPWSYTTTNGDGYLQDANGTFSKVSETVYMFHSGERVTAIRDLRNVEAPLTFTLSNGISYRQNKDGICEISK